MDDKPSALPRFAFSRRDPSAILQLAEKRLLVGGGLRTLALGGQPRDRTYFAQLLANQNGMGFAQFDLGLQGRAIEDEKVALERLFAFARSSPTVIFLDASDSVFEMRADPPGERSKVLATYLARVLKTHPVSVVFGMPEQVEADYARLPAIDMEVTFRAPSGSVIAGNPVLLPSHLIEDELLPAHNFQVEIGDVGIGLCAVTAPQLIGGPFSEHDFSPMDGVQGFSQLGSEARAAWPTITLRRAVTQSKVLFQWKASQYGGKPLVRDVVLRQLDWPNRRMVNTWVIRECWARRWTGPDFNAAQGAVAEEQLELFYKEVVWR